MRTIESSPQLYARIGGVLYLLNIVFGVFGEVLVRGRLIAAEPAATAANIASNQFLWRCSVATEYLALICAIALAMIYYYLLRPVSKEFNLLATFLRLVSITVQAVAVLNLDAVLFPLTNAGWRKAFPAEQIAAHVAFAIRSHGRGFGIALFILGFCFLVHGWLIRRSRYIPASLGILIQIAGVCYLTNSFAMILSPAVANAIFPLILLPAFIGELSLCVWLIVKGVNLPRWRERVGAP